MNYNYIELDQQLFAQEGSNFRDLNYLVQLLSREDHNGVARYKFFCKEKGMDELEDLPHFQALTHVDQLLIEESTNDAMLTGAIDDAKRIVSNTQEGINAYNITEAIRFFNAPVGLILENSLNDSYFIRAIFQHFGTSTRDSTNILLSFVDNGWISFVNAGGWTNIKNYIEERKQALETFASLQDKPPEKYLRYFVLMDSDKGYASDSTVRKDNLKEQLEALGCEVHVLQKRAMENYMPDEVIQDLGAPYASWIDVYNHLSDEQKDYLNYKDGMKRKGISQARTDEISELQALYPSSGENAITASDYDVLKNGLGTLGYPNYKRDFPKKYTAHNAVHYTTLLARAGGTREDNELKNIINKITSLL
ncbi:MAG: hypothetical protein AB8E82_13240 [Aureispira sp.]